MKRRLLLRWPSRSATRVARPPESSISIPPVPLPGVRHGKQERAGIFFRTVDSLSRARPSSTTAVEFEAWALAIARPLVIDWQATKKPQSLDTLTDPLTRAALQLRTKMILSPLPGSAARRRRKRSISLQRIPAIYRECWSCASGRFADLRDGCVLSHSLSTVKSRLYRCLEALRGALTGRAPHEPSARLAPNNARAGARRRHLASRARLAHRTFARFLRFAPSSLRQPDEALRSMRNGGDSPSPRLPAAQTIRVRRAPRNCARKRRAPALWFACTLSWAFRIARAPYVWRSSRGSGAHRRFRKLVLEVASVCGGRFPRCLRQPSC